MGEFFFKCMEYDISLSYVAYLAGTKLSYV